MTQLNLVYGIWSDDGNDLNTGNILGIFRDVNKAEDTMIATARRSFDHYHTPAKHRWCDYYDLKKSCDHASDRLYRIVDEWEYQTELTLLLCKSEDTFTDKAYVVFGTEDTDNWYCFYPMKKIFNNPTDAIAYATKLGCEAFDRYNVPPTERTVRFLSKNDDATSIFEIGDWKNKTTWFTVKELTIE